MSVRHGAFTGFVLLVVVYAWLRAWIWAEGY